MRILHFADIHLDRPFVDLAADDARARRAELRDAFDRCIAVARERKVDAVTIGGDLWEDEHVSVDTCRWVAARLQALDVPVVIVTGNHDPISPGGPYARAGWPENVTVIEPGSAQEVPLGPVSVWGVSWRAREALTADFLRSFTTPDDGRTHLLLLHGTAGPILPDRSPHCPFTGEQVRAAGFALCLAGHLHGAGDRGGVWYPGSPEPLGWSETARHGVLVVDVAESGRVEVELIDVNRRRYVHADVQCEGAASSADIEAALHDAVDELAREHGDGLCVRARLHGRVAPEVVVDTEALASSAATPVALLNVQNATRAAFDLDRLASHPTAVGRFVGKLRDRVAVADAAEERETLELALDLGLRAMHGEDVSRVG